MPITSIGYGGTVTEANTPSWARALNTADYGVLGAGDWRVSAVAAARTVQVALGTGWGRSVIDQQTGTPATVTLDSLTSGVRYDLVVAHRDWSGEGGITTFTKVTGNGSENTTFSTRARWDVAPGTDDQPLALVRVDGNSSGGAITAIRDLRVWPSAGGAVATDEKVLQYMDRPGTRLVIGDFELIRVVGPTLSAATWRRSPIAPVYPDRRVYTDSPPDDSWAVPAAFATFARVTIPSGAPTGDWEITWSAYIPSNDTLIADARVSLAGLAYSPLVRMAPGTTTGFWPVRRSTTSAQDVTLTAKKIDGNGQIRRGYVTISAKYLGPVS